MVDGREAFMAKLVAAEYAKGRHASPDELAHRVWLGSSRKPICRGRKGSNPKTAMAVEGRIGEGPRNLSPQA